MAKVSVARRQAGKKAEKRPTAGVIASWFKNFLEVKDEVVFLGERQGDLRDRLIDEVALQGEPDDKGHSWYELPEPVEFTDHLGKKFVFTALKRERHLSPASPTPDPAKAKALLKKENLWLTEAQEKQIKNLRIACPYAVITVDVDGDAVANAYFKDIITEKQYDSVLRDQEESFQFRPCES